MDIEGGFWQVMEILEGGEISQDRWNVPEEDEEEEFWGFDDLDDENESDTPSTSSTGSSQQQFS